MRGRGLDLDLDLSYACSRLLGSAPHSCPQAKLPAPLPPLPDPWAGLRARPPCAPAQGLCPGHQPE